MNPFMESIKGFSPVDAAAVAAAELILRFADGFASGVETIGYLLPLTLFLVRVLLFDGRTLFLFRFLFLMVGTDLRVTVTVLDD